MFYNEKATFELIEKLKNNFNLSFDINNIFSINEEHSELENIEILMSSHEKKHKILRIKNTEYYIFQNNIESVEKKSCLFRSKEKPCWNLASNLNKLFQSVFREKTEFIENVKKYTGYDEFHFFVKENAYIIAYSLYETKNDNYISYSFTKNHLLFNTQHLKEDSKVFEISVTYELNREEMTFEKEEVENVIDFTECENEKGFISIKKILLKLNEYINHSNYVTLHNKIIHYSEATNSSNAAAGYVKDGEDVSVIFYGKDKDNLLIKILKNSDYSQKEINLILSEEDLLTSDNIFKYCFHVEYKNRKLLKYYSEKNSYKNLDVIKGVYQRNFNTFTGFIFKHEFEHLSDEEKENLVFRRSINNPKAYEENKDPLLYRTYETWKNPETKEVIFKGHRFSEEMEKILKDVEATPETRKLLVRKPKGYEQDSEVSMILLNFGK